MTDYALQASFNRAALLLGLITGKHVVAWADRIIANDNAVPPDLLNVAMVPADDLSGLRHALQPMSTHEESLVIIRALLDVVRRDVVSGQRSAKDTVTVLAQMRRFLELPANYFDEIDTLQDDFMLAAAGVVGSTDEVEARLHAWLAQFDGGNAALPEGSTC